MSNSPTADSPLFFDSLDQNSEMNQAPIYTQISTHASDLPIVTVTSCNCESGYGPCNCPSCEQKLGVLGMNDSSNQIDDQNQLFGYTLPPPQIPNTSISDDELIHEIQSNDMLQSGNSGASTNNSPQMDAKTQRRMKMSQAARIRYHSLSADEKKALNERRIMLRKRRKQKDREMEELERILRATNDITDDLVPIDDPEAYEERRRKLNDARLRYQNLPPDERKQITLKRRLRQLGLPETADVNSEKVKRQIAEINARKAAAARARYHRMTPEERRIYNRRRTDSFRRKISQERNFRRRRLTEDKLLATPAGQISSDDLERAQNIMMRNAKRAEQARIRYQRKQQERGLMNRRAPRAKVESEENNNDSGEPNLDSILDSIERDVARRTQEARQALLRKNAATVEPKKEDIVYEHDQRLPRGAQIIHQTTPTLVQQGQLLQKIVQPTPSHSQPVIQYVQLPAGATLQNGFILADNKLLQIQCDPQSSHIYAVEQNQPKYEPGYHPSSNQQIIIHYDSQQQHQEIRQVQPQQLQRIEIVQPTAIISGSHGEHQQHQQQHIVHYAAQPTQHQQQPQYVIQIPQSSSGPSTSLSSRHVATSQHHGNQIVDEKLSLQRARRAERARRRYHEMSIEARHEFNAKRALSLKMARLRDDELCRRGEEYDQKGVEPESDLSLAIQQARSRRAKRAEAARLKYQRMTQEQRRAHNGRNIGNARRTEAAKETA